MQRAQVAEVRRRHRRILVEHVARTDADRRVVEHAALEGVLAVQADRGPVLDREVLAVHLGRTRVIDLTDVLHERARAPLALAPGEAGGAAELGEAVQLDLVAGRRDRDARQFAGGDGRLQQAFQRAGRLVILQQLGDVDRQAEVAPGGVVQVVVDAEVDALDHARLQVLIGVVDVVDVADGGRANRRGADDVRVRRAVQAQIVVVGDGVVAADHADDALFADRPEVGRQGQLAELTRNEHRLVDEAHRGVVGLFRLQVLVATARLDRADAGAGRAVDAAGAVVDAAVRDGRAVAVELRQVRRAEALRDRTTEGQALADLPVDRALGLIDAAEVRIVLAAGGDLQADLLDERDVHLGRDDRHRQFEEGRGDRAAAVHVRGARGAQHVGVEGLTGDTVGVLDRAVQALVAIVVIGLATPLDAGGEADIAARQEEQVLLRHLEVGQGQRGLADPVDVDQEGIDRVAVARRGVA